MSNHSQNTSYYVEETRRIGDWGQMQATDNRVEVTSGPPSRDLTDRSLPNGQQLSIHGPFATLADAESHAQTLIDEECPEIDPECPEIDDLEPGVYRVWIDNRWNATMTRGWVAANQATVDLAGESAGWTTKDIPKVADWLLETAANEWETPVHLDRAGVIAGIGDW